MARVHAFDRIWTCDNMARKSNTRLALGGEEASPGLPSNPREESGSGEIQLVRAGQIAGNAVPQLSLVQACNHVGPRRSS